ncbi:hypothetical protein HK098_001429 [Nowakowskiella sp. JEL0407]|nr:hypothetical protein HK098_001429 [Nowakowskiella sp. JEL0407]
MSSTTSLVIFVLCILSSSYALLPNCSTISVRREWRAFSASEKSAYLNAALALQTVPSLSGKSSIWADFAELHNDLANVVHGDNSNGIFLPWHRVFLAAYEYQLRKINPNITVPFWDSALDSESSRTSPVVIDFGGYGTTSPQSSPACIIGGVMSRARPDGGCIRRKMPLGSFRSFEELESIQFTRSYATYVTQAEALHGTVHAELGGSGSNAGQLGTMRSPYDPLFFLHHGNVDRKWDEWNAAFPNALSQYPTASRPNANVLIKLGGLFEKYDVTVRDIWNTTALCYVYAPSVGLSSEAENGSGARAFWKSLRTAGASYDPSEYQLPKEYSSNSTPILFEKDPTKLHYCNPLPKSYIIQNGMNETVVRQFEGIWDAVIDFFNSIEGYISPCARDKVEKSEYYVQLSEKQQEKKYGFLYKLLQGIKSAYLLVVDKIEEHGGDIFASVMDDLEKNVGGVDWEKWRQVLGGGKGGKK